MMMKERLLREFAERFGNAEGAQVYFAPGRVNLIGEHIDYNGGHVFSCTLDIGTYAVVRKRQDQRLFFYSMNYPDVGIINCSLANGLENDEEDGWANYPKGVIWAFGKRGMQPDCGLDMMVYGNIPSESGLSSSASLEVLTGWILRDIFDFEVSDQDIAWIGQYSENEFNGVNGSIMDQFAIAMGRENHGIYLNAEDLSHRYIPIHLDGVQLVIACTNKERGLADSKYNLRRMECERAVADLQKTVAIEKLGELSQNDFEACQSAIEDPVCIRRARHVVTENERTIQAVEALESNDLDTFGQLMNDSHRSLRDDYEVTGDELDALVEAAWETEGVLGSRMTGAGFGGCTISLVRTDDVDNFIKKVGRSYRQQIGYPADFYICKIGGGPVKL